MRSPQEVEDGFYGYQALKDHPERVQELADYWTKRAAEGAKFDPAEATAVDDRPLIDRMVDRLMTPEGFTSWVGDRTQREIIEVLGLGSRNTLARYMVRGPKKAVALACAALELGLKPWPEGSSSLPTRNAQ